MVQSKATTVEEYLSALSDERRAVVAAVRKLIKKHLPRGYRESMNWGMISYEIPLERYPNSYNGQPLSFAAVAAQKNHYAVYLNCVYQDSEQERTLRKAYAAAGKKLDMGKSCIRFKRLDDLVPDAIAEAIAGTPPEDFIAAYESARKR